MKIIIIYSIKLSHISIVLIIIPPPLKLTLILFFSIIFIINLNRKY